MHLFSFNDRKKKHAGAGIRAQCFVSAFRSCLAWRDQKKFFVDNPHGLNVCCVKDEWRCDNNTTGAPTSIPISDYMTECVPPLMRATQDHHMT